jgi:hypothetical protein
MGRARTVLCGFAKGGRRSADRNVVVPEQYEASTLVSDPPQPAPAVAVPVTDPTGENPRPRFLLIGPIFFILVAEGTIHLFAGLGAPVGEIAAGLTGPGPSYLLAALNYVAAVALASGRRIGWIVALSLGGWNVAYFIFLWVIGRPAYAGMALAVVIVFLLNSEEMRRAFGTVRG